VILEQQNDRVSLKGEVNTPLPEDNELKQRAKGPTFLKLLIAWSSKARRVAKGPGWTRPGYQNAGDDSR
jgi:hypothetical protein